MKIFYVEDNSIHVDLMKRLLTTEFGPSVELMCLETESALVDYLPQIMQSPPDVILLDVMLRWQDPTPNPKPVPEQVDREGFWRAGFRCYERLRNHGCQIPVIIYSVASRADLRDDLDQYKDPLLSHVAKSQPSPDLITAIRDAMRKASDLRRREFRRNP